MFLIFLGTILLLSPLLLVFYFKNRTLGFLYVLTGAAIFHILLALLAQYFHFFTYPAILSINVMFIASAITGLIVKKKKISFNFKVNWLLIFAALIIIFELYSVHYFYTGKVNTIDGNIPGHQVFNPYPNFSDEWAGVSFTTYSIDNNALPTVNPLIDDGFGHDRFRNIFIAFFAGLAEIFLILNIAPLFGFPIIAIATGAIVCYLIFLFLRSVRVSFLASLVGALCLPWITTSTNLPSIWYLFPFIGGTISYLTSLIAINYEDNRLAIVSGLVSLLLYPPLIVLVAPALFLYFIYSRPISFKNIFSVIGFSIGLVVLIAGIIFLVQPLSASNLLNFFFESLWRINLDGCIPARPIWHIIPFFLLPLAALGLYSAIKKKLWVLALSIFIALAFWIFYVYSPKFLIIDYARIAGIASYLLMISIGLGVEIIFVWLRKKFKFLDRPENWFNVSLIILAVFMACAFFYTRREAWQHIVLRFDTPDGIWIKPTNAPINNFLNQDDLDLFKGLYHQRFLSIPWKGLVIGAATSNYPLDAKPSIITNRVISYDYFLPLNCDDKVAEAIKYKISYIYSDRFNCQNFIEMGHSRERLYLYKFNPNL